MWVALCRCEWCVARRVGGAVPLGFAGRASCGSFGVGVYRGCLVAVSPRCAVGIGRRLVVSDAPCRVDWWEGSCG